MVLDVKDFCGDHFSKYTSIESCGISTTKIMSYVNYSSLKKKKKIQLTETQLINASLTCQFHMHPSYYAYIFTFS